MMRSQQLGKPHYRANKEPLGWIFPSITETHERYLKSTPNFMGVNCVFYTLYMYYPAVKYYLSSNNSWLSSSDFSSFVSSDLKLRSVSSTPVERLLYVFMLGKERKEININ